MNKNGRNKLIRVVSAIILVFLIVPLSPVFPIKEYRSNEKQLLVALTFDDGYECWTSNIMPTLERYGLTATGFINSPDFNPDFTWDNVQDLHDAGWEIGWHTALHIDVTRADQLVVINDFDTCKTLFEDHGLPSPVSFAYPWGKHDHESMAIVSEYFQAARTIHQGVNSPYHIHKNPYLLSSFKLKKGLPFIKNVVNEYTGQGTLIVFTGHVVGKADKYWSKKKIELTDEEFDNLARFLYEKKEEGVIDVVTFIDGVQSINQREDSPYWRLKLDSSLNSWEMSYGIPVPDRYIQLYDFLVQRFLRHSYPNIVPSFTPYIFCLLIASIIIFIGAAGVFTIIHSFRMK